MDGPRILIAEDDDATRALLRAFFEKKGFRVEAVPNGRIALERLLAGGFDVALLDVMMPEMTGFEALEQARLQAVTTPVIMATALSDAQDVVRGLAIGADDYVTKPFDLGVLHARVQLRLRRVPAQAPASPPAASAQGLTTLELSAGAVIDGRYELVDVIGKGSFGVVWRARHRGLESEVAVKVLRKAGESGTDRIDPIDSRGAVVPLTNFAERTDELRLEGVRAARVQHPNAVRMFDVGTLADGVAYLVMELLAGDTLEVILREEHTLTLSRAASILLPVLDALEVAHAQRVIHRDIKPANIMLHRTATGERVVKVLDFGVAKLVGAGGEHPGGAPGQGTGQASNRVIAGSPAYLAPERLRGHRYDGRADVYAVGIVLYEMLTGRVPFHSPDGDLMAVALMHLRERHIPPSVRNTQVPAAVDAVVAALLEKDPAKRPEAAAAAELLHRVLDDAA